MCRVCYGPDRRVHRVLSKLAMQRLTATCMQMDDIKEFRQWGSKTPGHPENFITEGVEVTTGAALLNLYLYRATLATILPLLMEVYVIAVVVYQYSQWNAAVRSRARPRPHRRRFLR